VVSDHAEQVRVDRDQSLWRAAAATCRHDPVDGGEEGDGARYAASRPCETRDVPDTGVLFYSGDPVSEREQAMMATPTMLGSRLGSLEASLSGAKRHLKVLFGERRQPYARRLRRWL
jgi:hypothetical protein